MHNFFIVTIRLKFSDYTYLINGMLKFKVIFNKKFIFLFEINYAHMLREIQYLYGNGY